MSYALSRRSLDRLNGVHPDIVAVIRLAIERTDIDFTVLEGLRSLDRQKQLVAEGASQTMNSRHLTGHAVDIAPYVDGEVSWHWPHYHRLAPAVKEAAQELGVALEWGGDWRSFKDGPHWQLSWDEYGKTDMAPRARGVKPTGPIPNAIVQIETPSTPSKPVVLPDDVVAVLDDADKSARDSSTVRSAIEQWGGTALTAGGIWWSQQTEGTQQAFIIGAAIIAAGVILSVKGGVKTITERLRKAKLGSAAKQALGL